MIETYCEDHMETFLPDKDECEGCHEAAFDAALEADPMLVWQYGDGR